jgi:YVTN family beta-propeller protein
VVAAGLVVAVTSTAVAQELTRAYVANRGAASVSVVDVRSGAAIRTIALEAPPYDLVVTSDLVFVSIPTANRLAIIDPLSLTVTGSVPVPGAPRDLDRRSPFGPQRLYISTDDGLRTYDRASNVLSAAVPVGPGVDRAIEASSAPIPAIAEVFVAACDGGPTVRTWNEFTGVVSTPVATGNSPCAVLLAANALYVANADDDTVTVFTPALQSPVTVPVADRPIGLVENVNGVWVASANGTLTLLDRVTHGVVTTRTVPGTPSAIGSIGMAFGPPGEDLLVVDSTGRLHVLSSNGDLHRTIPVGLLPGAVDVGDRNPAEPVTISTGGAWNDGPSIEPAISLDGRFVAFSSWAANLVAGDTNGVPDIFVRDRLLKTTTRVSVSSSGGQAEGGPTITFRTGSYAPSISATGRFVLFTSVTTNLVEGDTNGREDLFLHDRDADGDGLFDEPGQVATRRVSVQSDGSEATCRVPPLPEFGGPPPGCDEPHIQARLSTDGRHVVFSSRLEFDQGDVNGLSDIYVHDTVPGRTTRVSLRPDGAPGAGRAVNPVISPTGRIVAFTTSDPGMVPYDSNGVDDVFAVDRDADGNGIFDEQVPAFTHISLRPGGALYTIPSTPLGISHDDRWVAYASYLTVAIFDRTTGHNSLVRDMTFPTSGAGQFSGDGRHFAIPSGPSFVRIDRDPDADGVFDESGAVDVTEHGFALPSGSSMSDTLLRSIFVNVPGSIGGLGVRDIFGPALPLFDSDGDGLDNGFETRFGLNPVSAAGPDGPTGDPDGDGRTNLEEQLAGTHPRGVQTRYLAEGATGSFFSTRIAVANPETRPARVLLRYQTETGQTTSTLLNVAGRTRSFVNVSTVPSLASASFSTVVESDSPVVVDRSMFWSTGFFGSHAETSLASPSTTWFLAEGATHGAFDLFYLLQNPSLTSPAEVEIRFLLAAGPPIVRTYTVPAARRLTVYVDEVPGLEAADVSAVFTSVNAVPIIVERAMYYSRPETPFAGGHGSAAVTAPATRWFLAEGATGTFFDLFVLLANPSATPANVRITYLLPSGAPVVKTRTIAGNSRQTIYVENEDPALVDTAVSTIVESLNGVGIIVERAMWWPATGGWHEAHNSPGATTTATRWGFADGEVGPPPFNAQTYFLIANTSTDFATVQVTLLFDDGTAPATKTFTVAPNSRFNVPVGVEFPAAAGKGFGAVIESLGPAPVPIVVERAMYSDAEGVVWAAGTNALGTPIP